MSYKTFGMQMGEESRYMVAAQGVYKWLSDIPFFYDSLPREKMRRFVKLNLLLEEDANLSRYDETLLEARMSELEEIGTEQEVAYGVTLARINELALLCAGDYADHGEVQAVGDLLFNPRRIVIHVAGMAFPVVKKRHMALTEQFSHVGLTTGAVVDWLRDNTNVEIQQQALLPHLYQKLSETDVLSPNYLDSVEERTIKVADLIGFLASGHFPNNMDIQQWLPYARTGDRKLFESKLCRFKKRIFFELGEVFGQILDVLLFTDG